MSKLPANVGNLANALLDTKRSIQANSTAGLAYLKFTKGEWTFGQEEVEILPENEDLWVADPSSVQRGFIAWGREGDDKGKKLGEEMSGISETPIIKSSLPEVGAPWSQQLGINLVCIEGEHEGTAVQFKTNSFGGVKAMEGLITALHAQVVAEQSSGGDDIVPVIELDVSHYKHKTHGKVYEPVINIIEWASLSEGIHEMPTSDDEDEDDEPEEQEAPRKRSRTTKGKEKSPAKKGRTKKAEKPEPEIVEDDDVPDDLEDVETADEPEDEQPTRRRRKTVKRRS